MNQYAVENLGYEKFVHLDSAGVQALNLFSNTGSMSKNDSILGIFDKCRTPHGHRLTLFCFSNLFHHYIISTQKKKNVINNDEHFIV